MAEAYFYTSRDLVEVVRCKDCKYYDEDIGCGGISIFGNHDGYAFILPKPDDFCSYGKTKEEDE